MEDIIIRRSVPDDAEEISEIEKMCFPEPWSLETLRSEFSENPRAVYVTAECGGKAAGYAGLWKISDEGHINNVAVSPAYRRQKAGERLIRELIRISVEKGIRHFTLEVRESNDAARRLYEKCGFSTVGVRKGYYLDNGEDALIMWRHENED